MNLIELVHARGATNAYEEVIIVRCCNDCRRLLTLHVLCSIQCLWIAGQLESPTRLEALSCRPCCER